MYCLCRSANAICVRIILLDETDFLHEIKVRGFSIFYYYYLILFTWLSLKFMLKSDTKIDLKESTIYLHDTGIIWEKLCQT